MTPDCQCDLCRREKIAQAIGPNAIVCVRTEPGGTEYMAPNLSTEWLLTQGWEYSLCGRRLQKGER